MAKRVLVTPMPRASDRRLDELLDKLAALPANASAAAVRDALRAGAEAARAQRRARVIPVGSDG